MILLLLVGAVVAQNSTSIVTTTPTTTSPANVPLAPAEYDALMSVYREMNCPSLNCVNFAEQAACVSGVWSDSPQLSCLNGHVVALDLSLLNLNGSLPTHIGALTMLTYLDMSNNGLVGSIPSEFAQLTALSSVDLSQNQLISVAPSTWLGVNWIICALQLSLPTEGNCITHCPDTCCLPRPECNATTTTAVPTTAGPAKPGQTSKSTSSSVAAVGSGESPAVLGLAVVLAIVLAAAAGAGIAAYVCLVRARRAQHPVAQDEERDSLASAESLPLARPAVAKPSSIYDRVDAPLEPPTVIYDSSV